MRNFLRLFLILAIYPAIAFGAVAPAFVDGENYTTLGSQLRTNSAIENLLKSDPEKVQVIFFFSYGCPACANFDPHFERWVKDQVGNKKLAIYSMPVSFDDQREKLARLYYTMKILDPKQSLNAKIFSSIHEDHQQLWQVSEMQDFFVQHGYSAVEFDNTYNSDTVTADVKRADAITVAYAITKTPTIIINGPKASYRLNLDQADNNIATFFKILNYLVANK